ncbi:NAD(P)/FAD-dependent oxidoreductase [Variovorax sp. J31P207]|uniref:flavin-containing monooxygenase n=1 Tax=Variovorax sp. J31P207 TaxID=3053510 RepID=UPI002578428A|nr:NAD(P)/FAD-dependent oxidoreductase [Variovorax sp. J31P207]MDM0066200.1 NAD(P)/FAD-dependent oxidoreductase [Variovorax sp. J31P207]
MTDEFVDVLVVGAGISGIGAGCHLQKLCPERSFAIVEARPSLGGTWDLFRYPGVRSDSDMHTLGYSFRPWTDPKAIADGPTILNYLRETAREHGLEPKIRFGQRVVRADWSSPDAQWTVELRRADGTGSARIRCGFLFMCSGYYDYAAGHQPDFPGRERFGGRLVHPQHWPADLDCAGKKIVVIGSGATAVTLVPALADKAAHVTMLQRSPTWMVARPSVDPVGMRLRRRLPLRLALQLTRWKNVLLGMYVFRLSRRNPQRMRQLLLGGVRHALGPEADIATHFTPRYNPWEQRLCLVPDGDFFRAINAGRASVVTDHIASLTETGIALRSGATLDADVIVSATGLQLAMLGHAALHVDGERVEPSRTVNYKGLMYSGVPNMANTFGYTNASWTLKADLTAQYVCRLLNHMRKTGARICRPPADPDTELQPWVDFSSGYFERAADQLPKQGSAKPWKLNQNYLSDLVAMRFGAVDDGVLQFTYGSR